MHILIILLFRKKVKHEPIQDSSDDEELLQPKKKFKKALKSENIEKVKLVSFFLTEI